MREKYRLHRSVREALGYSNSKESDNQALLDWKKRVRSTCKPCWELKYCPYGPLVEQFPLPPIIQEEAKAHNRYLLACLKSGTLGNGDKLDAKRKIWFEKDVGAFDVRRYPKSVPKVLAEAACRVFGHICPVYFAAEPFTETKERRSHSRGIQRDVMLRVVRRDGQICQKCHEPVPDNEVEFDHIIPFGKGGRSTLENLRLVHRNCNRRRGVSLGELLSENPVRDHYPLLLLGRAEQF